ncbi:MAG: diacylglycerol kinase family lipid kinase [Anaerolineae bacterium]|nr:diacylglycerol kinase family lipid kinase [Anaerolineae bacterium]MCO5198476.1 diacylglycerol kinase family lipid kinase [Anaerolineae bacterium]MCO5205927.1 diacylglycerol kinase family lipid kinase [Anaerolineae bacterium]
MQRATLIYNPLAGPLNCAEMMEDVARYWRSREWDVSVKATEYAGHATELARQAAAQGFQLVFAAGGDGTQGEVATGLAFTDTVMATIPIGTGNSLAKEMQMPRPSRRQPNRAIDAAEALYRGRVFSADLGQNGDGRFWLLWGSVGIDSYLVDQIEPRSKRFKRLGAAGYVLKGAYSARQLPRWKLDVEVDGTRINGDFLFAIISNCRLFGGGVIELSPGALFDDGMFEVWLFPGKTRRDLMRNLWQVATGGHLEDEAVVMVHGRQVRMATDPAMPFQIDGDAGGETPFSAEIRPRALRMLIPDTAPASLFSKQGISVEKL